MSAAYYETCTQQFRVVCGRMVRMVGRSAVFRCQASPTILPKEAQRISPILEWCVPARSIALIEFDSTGTSDSSTWKTWELCLSLLFGTTFLFIIQKGEGLGPGGYDIPRYSPDFSDIQRKTWICHSSSFDRDMPLCSGTLGWTVGWDLFAGRSDPWWGNLGCMWYF